MIFKLMLADRSVTIQKVIQLTFSHPNYAVVSVEPEEPFESALKEQRPDVLLVDFSFFGAQVDQAFQQLRQTPEGQKLFVILLARIDDDFSIEKIREWGINDFILKPLDNRELFQKIHNYFLGRLEQLHTDAAPAHLQEDFKTLGAKLDLGFPPFPLRDIKTALEDLTKELKDSRPAVQPQPVAALDEANLEKVVQAVIAKLPTPAGPQVLSSSEPGTKSAEPAVALAQNYEPHFEELKRKYASLQSTLDQHQEMLTQLTSAPRPDPNQALADKITDFHTIQTAKVTELNLKLAEQSELVTSLLERTLADSKTYANHEEQALTKITALLEKIPQRFELTPDSKSAQSGEAVSNKVTKVLAETATNLRAGLDDYQARLTALEKVFKEFKDATGLTLGNLNRAIVDDQLVVKVEAIGEHLQTFQTMYGSSIGSVESKVAEISDSIIKSLNRTIASAVDALIRATNPNQQFAILNNLQADLLKLHQNPEFHAGLEVLGVKLEAATQRLVAAMSKLQENLDDNNEAMKTVASEVQQKFEDLTRDAVSTLNSRLEIGLRDWAEALGLELNKLKTLSESLPSKVVDILGQKVELLLHDSVAQMMTDSTKRQEQVLKQLRLIELMETRLPDKIAQVVNEFLAETLETTWSRIGTEYMAALQQLGMELDSSFNRQVTQFSSAVNPANTANQLTAHLDRGVDTVLAKLQTEVVNRLHDSDLKLGQVLTGLPNLAVWEQKLSESIALALHEKLTNLLAPLLKADRDSVMLSGLQQVLAELNQVNLKDVGIHLTSLDFPTLIQQAIDKATVELKSSLHAETVQAATQMEAQLVQVLQPAVRSIAEVEPLLGRVIGESVRQHVHESIIPALTAFFADSTSLAQSVTAPLQQVVQGALAEFSKQSPAAASPLDLAPLRDELVTVITDRMRELIAAEWRQSGLILNQFLNGKLLELAEQDRTFQDTIIARVERFVQEDFETLIAHQEASMVESRIQIEGAVKAQVSEGLEALNQSLIKSGSAEPDSEVIARLQGQVRSQLTEAFNSSITELRTAQGIASEGLAHKVVSSLEQSLETLLPKLLAPEFQRHLDAYRDALEHVRVSGASGSEPLPREDLQVLVDANKVNNLVETGVREQLERFSQLIVHHFKSAVTESLAKALDADQLAAVTKDALAAAVAEKLPEMIEKVLKSELELLDKVDET